MCPGRPPLRKPDSNSLDSNLVVNPTSLHCLHRTMRFSRPCSLYLCRSGAGRRFGQPVRWRAAQPPHVFDRVRAPTVGVAVTGRPEGAAHQLGNSIGPDWGASPDSPSIIEVVHPEDLRGLAR